LAKIAENCDHNIEPRYLECRGFLTEPSDVAVYNNNFYICDFKVGQKNKTRSQSYDF
jgi:hypothetical protein